MRRWTAWMAALALLLLARSAAAEPVKVVADEQGMQLVVAGKPMMVFGMNWDYQPIGENYSYDFWGKPDAFIEEALATGVDAVLLDNMTPEQLATAVRMIDGRALAEASGRITPQTAPASAASGVDLLSAGWLTHSASKRVSRKR